MVENLVYKHQTNEGNKAEQFGGEEPPQVETVGTMDKSRGQSDAK